MSNVEHLIENAICVLERGKDYDYWMDMWQTKEQLKYVKSPPEEIWEMAVYCCFTYKDSVAWKTEDEIVAKYGYPIPEN